MSLFVEEYPSLESYWRSIILFGRNVASYKFALGRSLLELSSQEKTFISLEELAVPFAKHITRHLRISDKQGTSSSSKFLKACREFNEGNINQEKLIERTVSLGFVNVIDAFHIVNQEPIPMRFFEDLRKTSNKGITITDDLLRLKESLQYQNLPSEIESRWRLVETSWTLNMSRRSLEVFYDDEYEILYNPSLDRPGITSCRSALNGYQKGKCFYCFSDISIDEDTPNAPEVDHFFPHVLKRFGPKAYIDGVWNLVLACISCNRGVSGKMARLPEIKYLQRLHKRNNFFIDSHHPLRDTLVKQTGQKEAERRSFLQKLDRWALGFLIHRWRPSYEHEPCF